jgi:hypothetical protein
MNYLNHTSSLSHNNNNNNKRWIQHVRRWGLRACAHKYIKAKRTTNMPGKVKGNIEQQEIHYLAYLQLEI